MAGGLKEVRERIGSVQNTMQITSAMKMVSAAKLRRAQDADEGAAHRQEVEAACGQHPRREAGWRLGPSRRADLCGRERQRSAPVASACRGRRHAARCGCRVRYASVCRLEAEVNKIALLQSSIISAAHPAELAAPPQSARPRESGPNRRDTWRGSQTAEPGRSWAKHRAPCCPWRGKRILADLNLLKSYFLQIL